MLTKENAQSYCTVGPTSRASGIPHDVRLSSYAGYGLDGLKFRPIFKEEGDSWARTAIRVDEAVQSVNIIEQCLGMFRDGPILAESKGHPDGEAFSRVEAPRGELFYYIRGNGTPTLDRIKLRTPAFVNVPALGAMIPGAELADVPVITASGDPCICCTDR